MNHAVTYWSQDPEGRPDGWPKTLRDLGNETGPLAAGETLATTDQIQAAMENLTPAMVTWEAARKAQEPYIITDFFDRLTPQQRGTIRALAKDDDTIADLWDNLLALREGVECPPDGATPGRAKSQAAKAACAQIFGESEAQRLFARP
jgi:hypothetical protein